MDKKAALLASALSLAASTASAVVTFTPTGDATFTQLFNPAGGVFAAGAYDSGQLGRFTFDAHGRYSLTYLGQESAYQDGVMIAGTGASLTESNVIGDWILGKAGDVGALLDFGFFSSDGGSALNGAPGVGGSSFVLLGSDVQTARGSFQYLVGYNDGAAHDDWDDFVFGLNAMPAPEPQTYALMLAGLGAVAFVARRRRRR